MGTFFVLDLILIVLRSSLLNSRPIQLVLLREKQQQAVDRTLLLLEKPRLRATLRLVVILVHFLLAGSILLLAQEGIPGATIGAIIAILAGAAIVVLLFEFGMEGIILHHPEEWAVRFTPLGYAISFLFSPIAAIMVAVLGSPEALQQKLGPVTEDELKNWVEIGQAQGSLERDERKMIASIFEFGDTLCREIMVPRIDILALEATSSIQEAIHAFSITGHSRVPVYEETIDNIIGLLYAKDLLKHDHADEANSGSIRKYLRPAYFVPEAKKVDELLREMQARGIHLAVVVDEYGGTAGLVTLEDIVEEIVGEIRDEYDQGEELLFQQVTDDEYIFSGRIDLDDLNDLIGTHLTKDMADTLGGYIYAQVGRVPVGGEKIIVNDWVLTVEQVSGRRIRKVHANRFDSISEVEEEKDEFKRGTAKRID